MKSNVEVYGILAAVLLVFVLAISWRVSIYNDCRDAGMAPTTCFMVMRR